MSGRRYSAAERQTIVAMYLAGDKTCREIAKSVGCSLATLSIWTRGLHRQRAPRPTRTWDDETRQRAVELYVEDKKGARHISKALGPGLSVRRVLQWIRDAGIEPRDHGPVPVIDRKSARQAYLEHGVTKAAKMIGCTPSAIYRAMARP